MPSGMMFMQNEFIDNAVGVVTDLQSSGITASATESRGRRI